MSKSTFTKEQIEELEVLISQLIPAPGASVGGDATNLYVLRYRRGMRGVNTGFIRASSRQMAEKVAHAWCNSLPGCMFVHLEEAVLADESFLTKPASDVA